jgi:hypothetical protein
MRGSTTGTISVESSGEACTAPFGFTRERYCNGGS